MEFLKSMWSSVGVPLPGMVTPTLDTDELGKRIADLKAVEGWLKSNLSLLQMTIQGLEMQRSTLAAMHALSQSGKTEEGATNPFASAAMWPWNFMQQAAAAAGVPEAAPAAKPAAPKKR